MRACAARRRLVATGLASALLALVACGSDAGDSTDAAPGERPDAPTPDPTAGLVVAWELAPDVPVSLGDGATLDRLVVRLRDVRAFGDAAPGDGRTSLARLELDWQPGARPPPLRFGAAPAGLYSRLVFEIAGDGSDAALELHGTWTDGARVWPTLVRVTTRRSVQRTTNVRLSAGGSATLTVTTDVVDVADDIEWDSVAPDAADVRVLDGPAADEVAQQLLDKVTVSGSSSDDGDGGDGDGDGDDGTGGGDEGS